MSKSAWKTLIHMIFHSSLRVLYAHRKKNVDTEIIHMISSKRFFFIYYQLFFLIYCLQESIFIYSSSLFLENILIIIIPRHEILQYVRKKTTCKFFYIQLTCNSSFTKPYSNKNLCTLLYYTSSCHYSKIIFYVAYH